MAPDQHDVRRAVAIRNLAERRVRRITYAAVAGATALTGIFAGLAAASTHSARRIVRPGVAGRVIAPEPTLVPDEQASQDEHADREDPQASQTQVQPPVAAPPSSPPVVSSGGS